MNYEAVTGSEKRRAMKNVNHTVLVPRSHFAQVNHAIGQALKIGLTIWGLSLSVYLGRNPVLGIAGGLLCGGIACTLFYLVTGIKSRFYHSRKYPTVRNYLQKGYESGSDSGSQFFSSEWLYFINGLLT